MSHGLRPVKMRKPIVYKASKPRRGSMLKTGYISAFAPVVLASEDDFDGGVPRVDAA